MRRLLPALGLVFFLSPLLFLVISSLSAEPEVFQAFWEFQAYDVFVHTFGYGALVALLACLFGGTWGFLCAQFDFPGRQIWLWLIPAPLAIPVYVYAFIYLGVWQSIAGHSRPTWLLVALFALASAPYAYLLSFQAFRSESTELRETSDLLNIRGFEYFRLVRWPLARPLIMAGFFVVFSEFIADFGAVQLFNIRTFSTAIYSLWSAYLSFATASLVSLILALAIVAVLFFQSRIKSFSHTSKPVSRRQPRLAWLITISAFAYTLVGFIGPVIWLITLSAQSISSATSLSDLSLGSLYNTAGLSGVFAALLTLLVSVTVFFSRRQTKLLPSLLQFGYSMPGTILAVSVTVPFFYLQRWFDDISLSVPMAVAMMFVAWAIRFLKVSWEPLAKNRLSFPQEIEEAASIHEPFFLARWHRIFLPLLKNGLLSSILFLFIEVAKELPIALLTRPLGWETLSIQVFEYTSESDWQRASVPALMIVALGCIGLAALLKERKSHA